MSIHTFITEQDVERWAHVSDPDLDILYQDVKELSRNRILLQEQNVYIKRLLTEANKKGSIYAL